MRTWTDICLHHSLTRDGKVVDAEAIRRYHKSWRFNGMILTPEEARGKLGEGVRGIIPPWKDIGYHWLIERVAGVIHTIEGRSMEEDGAHCKEGGMNHRAIGICLVGNFNKTDETREPPGSGPPDQEMEIALGHLIIRLHDEGRWTPPTDKSYNILNYVHGHREFATYKLCPGSAFDVTGLKEVAYKFI